MLRSVESICHHQNPVVSPLRLDVKANPLREGRDHLERFEEDTSFALLSFLHRDRVVNARRTKDGGQFFFNTTHSFGRLLTDNDILEILWKCEETTAVTGAVSSARIKISGGEISTKIKFTPTTRIEILNRKMSVRASWTYKMAFPSLEGW